jgi:hypothetical protein
MLRIFGTEAILPWGNRLKLNVRGIVRGAGSGSVLSATEVAQYSARQRDSPSLPWGAPRNWVLSCAARDMAARAVPRSEIAGAPRKADRRMTEGTPHAHGVALPRSSMSCRAGSARRGPHRFAAATSRPVWADGLLRSSQTARTLVNSDGGNLESGLGASPRGFESRILRHMETGSDLRKRCSHQIGPGWGRINTEVASLGSGLSLRRRRARNPAF